MPGLRIPLYASQTAGSRRLRDCCSGPAASVISCSRPHLRVCGRVCLSAHPGGSTGFASLFVCRGQSCMRAGLFTFRGHAHTPNPRPLVSTDAARETLTSGMFHPSPRHPTMMPMESTLLAGPSRRSPRTILLVFLLVRRMSTLNLGFSCLRLWVACLMVHTSEKGPSPEFTALAV